MFDSTPARVQQHATRAAFFIPGFVIAGWAPLVPFAKARASLDDAGLGIVLLGLGLGSIIAMPLSGVLATRFGCRAVMLVATLVMSMLLPMLALVSTPTAIGAVLFVFGAAIGTMDCVMNLQAVIVERESGRSMMSGFHAFYSVGSLFGAGLVSMLLSGRFGILPAAMLLSLIAIVIALMSMRGWRGEAADKGGGGFALPRGIVILIGMVCFVSFLVEGSMLDWSAVFLHEVRGVDLERAGWGFVAFNLAMTAMRLLGDRIVDRLGHSRAVLVGGLVAAAGLLIVTLMPSNTTILTGFVLIGFGCANIVPVMYTQAGRQTRVPENIAIPAVTTMGYAGVLLGPALIGFIAQQWSLSIAFMLSAAALAIVAVVGALMRVR